MCLLWAFYKINIGSKILFIFSWELSRNDDNNNCNITCNWGSTVLFSNIEFVLSLYQVLWGGVSWSAVCARGLDQTSARAHPQDELQQARTFQTRTPRGKDNRFTSWGIHLIRRLHQNCPLGEPWPHQGIYQPFALVRVSFCCRRYYKIL